MESVGQRGRHGLVEDAGNLQAGDLPGLLCRPSALLSEVGGDRNHGPRDRTDLRLGLANQVGENDRRQALRSVHPAADFFPPLVAHVILHELDDATRVEFGILERDLPDDHLALVEEDDARRHRLPRAIGDHARLGVRIHEC